MVLEESTTYQAIIRKGRLSGVREVLFRLGQKRLGPADDATTALNAIDDVQRLEELIERVYEVANWEELLQPASRRLRNGRRQGNM